MSSFTKISKWWIGFLSVIIFQFTLLPQSGINSVGGFEQDLPSYWTKGAEPSNSTLSWATDESRSLGKSLKIEKGITTEAAVWESENMVDLWSPRHIANIDINVGAYVKTLNVNTNPANDDERWWVSYSFYDSAGGLIGETKLPIDQSTATSSGWLADTNEIGETILPEDSWTTIIKFVAGKNATGTVWADDFLLYARGGQPWIAGQDWNTAVGVPTGWFYWLPPDGGNNGVLSAGYENTRITNEESYDGSYSLKFDLPVGTRDGFVGTRRFELTDVVPGDNLRITVWIKGENLQPDSVIAVGDQWSVAITPIFHKTLGNNEGFGDYWASDIPLEFPYATSFDWKQFYIDVTVPDPPVGEVARSISVRLHPLSRFSGTVWMDDLKVEKLDLPGINEIGSFEQTLPSYWTKGNEPAGTTLSWATDEFRSLGRSLKIAKTSTGDSASWISENMVDLWSPRHIANIDINVGAYVKTLNVNTNPANDDERWWVSYSFYDSAGGLIGETKLPIDQSTATSSGWLADTNEIGETILPEDSWTTIIKFVAGKNATGTVWADDFLLYARGGQPWIAGQDWNTAVGVPTGWFYWLPPDGGNNGVLSAGYENTRITNEESYDGSYSLKFDLPVGTRDGFVGTRRFELTDVVPGDNLRITVWIKGENLQPDSVIAVGDQWSVAITPIFHKTLGNNEGFGDYWASDIPLEFPYATSFDWTQFFVNVVVPEPPAGEVARSISVRLHPLGRFSGTVYLDVLEVKKAAPTSVENEFLPVSHNLFQNYPNPFNPSTVISYSIPNVSFVSLKIYDILGREVRTLVNSEQNIGIHNIQWNGDNNYGDKVSTGIYLYKIEAGDFIMTKKMLLLK